MTRWSSTSGTLPTRSPGALVLDNAPSALGCFFIAAAVSPTPFEGGLLLPTPPLAVLASQTSAAGSSTLSWAHWPTGVSGQSVSFQRAIMDTRRTASP
jgi:hypothetical protein